jgi:hypothetical protein
MEASIPHPPLAPIEGVEITYDKQTSIGLNGRKENKIILEGRNGAIALGLARFQLEEKTITIRTDTTQIQQASPHVVAA